MLQDPVDGESLGRIVLEALLEQALDLGAEGVGIYHLHVYDVLLEARMVLGCGKLGLPPKA